MLNVYLKTSVYAGGLGRSELVTAIHPPIDGGLWVGLKKPFRIVFVARRRSLICAAPNRLTTQSHETSADG